MEHIDTIFLENAIRIAMLIAFTVGCWWCRDVLKKNKDLADAVTKIKEYIGDVEKSLMAHKLYASETFSTKAEMNAYKNETKESIQRVHSQLEKGQEKLESKIDRLYESTDEKFEKIIAAVHSGAK